MGFCLFASVQTKNPTAHLKSGEVRIRIKTPLRGKEVVFQLRCCALNHGTNAQGTTKRREHGDQNLQEGFPIDLVHSSKFIV